MASKTHNLRSFRMLSEFDFGAKTRMIAIEIPNEDIFCFHENFLRYHSSYIDDRVKEKDRDEIENPVKLRLDWDVVECSDIPAPDANPLSLSMKLFTQWIYRIGARTWPDDKPDEKPEWTEIVPTLDVLINMVSLGDKLNIKPFQDDALQILKEIAFSVDNSLFKNITVILCRSELFNIIMQQYTHQLELECNDMEAIRSRLDHLEIFMPDGSVSPSAGSWKTLIAGILNAYNMRMERIRKGFE
ncbi:hypothetical protein F4806DRAFT_294480 [Annulohypoxylon nitens]|nr:hypothetical protein F4806DRAFT_294480 [Annulohypoxylon nitens]